MIIVVDACHYYAACCRRCRAAADAAAMPLLMPPLCYDAADAAPYAMLDVYYYTPFRALPPIISRCRALPAVTMKALRRR